MQSRLIPGLVQEVNTDVTSHDFDVDADVWTQEGREVFRGQRDPQQSHDVYWLQDDGVQRVGLVEYDPQDSTRMEVLWYQDNPFATQFQEPEWTTTGDTLWTEMPIQAQEQCLTHGITKPEQVQARTKKTILTLQDLLNGKRVSDLFSVFCVDQDCVIYNPPPNSRLWLTLRGDGEQEPQTPAKAPASVQAD